jgi:hypothetical protein
LQEAQQLWDVLNSLRDDFEEGTGNCQARAYDVIAYLDAAVISGGKAGRWTARY